MRVVRSKRESDKQTLYLAPSDRLISEEKLGGGQSIAVQGGRLDVQFSLKRRDSVGGEYGPWSVCHANSGKYGQSS